MERRKLELELNKPTHIEMLFNNAKVGESQYGMYYLYAVRNGDGNEYSFFAPEEVHEKLSEFNKGDAVVITKTAVQKGNKVVTSYDVTPDQHQGLTEGGSKVSSNQNPPTASEQESSIYFKAMVESFEEAIKIQEKFNGMANVNQIAITIFIQKTKAGGY